MQTLLRALREHPHFQDLQNRWLGLHLCVQAANQSILLRVLALRQQEWLIDMDCITAKILHQEFSQAGGRPFGLLIIDEDRVLDSQNKHLIRELSDTAHQAFVPILFNQTTEMSSIILTADLSSYLFTVEPQLMSPQGEWIGAAYGCCAMLCRVYNHCQWFYDVDSLQSLCWEMPQLITRLAEKCDVIGRASLRPTKSRLATLQLEETYPYQNITCKAQALMALLALTRFAHYLKIMLRDTIGSEHSPALIVQKLANWLRQYCAQASSTAFSLFYPLANCEVSLCEPQGPGQFKCKIELTLNGLAYQSVSWIL